MQKSFFFPSLNLITFEGSSLFRKIIKLQLTPLWQEFDHRLETISFKPRICVLKEEWPTQTTPEICFPLVTTNLLGCAVISRTQLQNEKFQMYSCAALKGKSKTKKGYFALTNLFFKTRFCKDQWESTEVIWSATPWTAERDRGYQEHTEPRTGHKIITALETPQPLSTHIWCFCKVLMFQQNKPVVMFLLIWQADPQHSQTATSASYTKNVAPNLPEGLAVVKCSSRC